MQQFFSLLTMLDSFIFLLYHICYLNLFIPLFTQLHVVTNLIPITWYQSKQSMQSQEGMRVALSALDELQKWLLTIKNRLYILLELNS